MTWLVALFGIAITWLGILGLVRPGSLIRLVQRPWQSQGGLYLSTASEWSSGSSYSWRLQNPASLRPFRFWASFLWWLRWLPHFSDSLVYKGSSNGGRVDHQGLFADGRWWPLLLVCSYSTEVCSREPKRLCRAPLGGTTGLMSQLTESTLKRKT